MSSREGQMSATVSAETRQRLRSLALDLDVDDAILLGAILVGSLKSGNAQRHAMEGLEAIPHKRRARRDRLRWVPDAPTVSSTTPGASQEAATWVYKDWSMVRLGDPKAHRSAGEDEGWYLEGPGLDEPLRVGVRRGEAMTKADDIIQVYEKKQAASGDV